MAIEATQPTLGERLTALKAPRRRLNDYGDRACGCTWDSGPYDIFCDQHDPDALTWDALKELHAAADAALKDASPANLAALSSAVSDVGRILAEGVSP